MFDPLLIPILINKLGKKINILDKETLDDLNISKLHVLYLIALSRKPDGYTLKELSEYLGYDKANTSRVVKHLLKIGYAKKVLQDNMQLKYEVVLTDIGYQVAKKIVEKELAQNVNLFSLFTHEEMDVMKSVIIKLIDFLV